VPEKDSNQNIADAAEDAAGEPSSEARALQEDATREDAELRKLSGDLDELKQTLLRRQADFDNYRKRIERERGEDAKRATSRVIEALIPVLDGFEQALAAHREAEYETYRKGFELIYKQLPERRSIHTCTRRWTARRRRNTPTARFCRYSSQAMCFTGAFCGPLWCA